MDNRIAIGTPIGTGGGGQVESWDFDKIAPFMDNEICIGFQLPSKTTTITRTVMRSEYIAPDHAHPYDQVVIVNEGDMSITCNGRLFPLSKGMVLRIPAGAVHGATVKPGCDFTEVGFGVGPSASAAPHSPRRK
jgi:quercetin dioxygenase-like cupin family protein